MKIHIEQYGQGHPLLMIHGWGFNCSLWYPLIPHLSQKFTLYLCDLPGFGNSPFYDYELNQLCDLLAPSLPKKFACLGWSLGGLASTAIALNKPHRVSHLINVASSPHFLKQQQWPGIQLSFFKRFAREMKHDFTRTMSDFLKLQCPEKKVDKKLLDSIVTNPPSQCGLKKGLELLAETDFRHQLKELSMPCHYLLGRLDKLAPIELKDALAPVCVDEFHHSAHMPFVTEQQKFCRLLEEHII